MSLDILLKRIANNTALLFAAILHMRLIRWSSIQGGPKK